MIRARAIRRRFPLAAPDATRAVARLRDDLVAIGPRLVATLGTSGVVAVLGLLSGAVAARDLGPEARGQLAMLLLWPQLFCTVGNMGVDLAATYLSADPARRHRVPATLGAIATAQTAVLVPAYLLTMPLVLEGSAETRDSLYLATLIPLYLAGNYAVGALMGWQNFRAFNIVRIATPLLYTAGIVALATSDRLSPGTAAATFVVANGTADLLAMLMLWRQAGVGTADADIARDAIAYGIKAHAGRLSPAALGVDAIVVALFLSSRDLGLFVAATAFLAAPRLITAALSMVFFPHVSASHLAGEPARLRAMAMAYALGAIVPALVLAAFARPAVVGLFGAEYAGGVPVLQLLSISALALALRAFPSDLLRGRGRPGLTSIAEAASWVAFLALAAGGAWLGGVEGVAAGAAIAGVLSLAITTAMAYRCGAFALSGDSPAEMEAAA